MRSLHVKVTDDDGHARLVNMSLTVAVDPIKAGGCTLLRIVEGSLAPWLHVREGIDAFAGLPGFIPLRFGSALGWGDVTDGLVNMAHVAEIKKHGSDAERSSIVFVDELTAPKHAKMMMICRGTVDDILERLGGVTA